MDWIPIKDSPVIEQLIISKTQDDQLYANFITPDIKTGQMEITNCPSYKLAFNIAERAFNRTFNRTFK